MAWDVVANGKVDVRQLKYAHPDSPCSSHLSRRVRPACRYKNQIESVAW